MLLFSLPDAWREDGAPFGSLVSIITLTIWYNFSVGSQLVCVEIKRERGRKTIYIIGAALCQERINFFLRSLISGKKDNVHTEEKAETHCITSAVVCVGGGVGRGVMDGECELVFKKTTSERCTFGSRLRHLLKRLVACY